jgi:hypothetical protein
VATERQLKVRLLRGLAKASRREWRRRVKEIKADDVMTSEERMRALFGLPDLSVWPLIIATFAATGDNWESRKRALAARR